MVRPTQFRRLLRLPDVRAATALRTTKLYQLVRDGLFPAPIKRGRSSFWIEDEVAAVNDAFIAGSSESELRELVKKLLAARGGDTHKKPAPLTPAIKSPRRSNRALASAP